jgi:hypothetical protein
VKATLPLSEVRVSVVVDINVGGGEAVEVAVGGLILFVGGIVVFRVSGVRVLVGRITVPVAVAYLIGDETGVGIGSSFLQAVSETKTMIMKAITLRWINIPTS